MIRQPVHAVPIQPDFDLPRQNQTNNGAIIKATKSQIDPVLYIILTADLIVRPTVGGEGSPAVAEWEEWIAVNTSGSDLVMPETTTQPLEST